MKAAMDGSQILIEKDSVPEPHIAAVKEEVAVSSKVGLTGDLPVEGAGRGWATQVEDSSCAEPHGAVKTEVRISLPPKRKVAGCELKTTVTVGRAESNMSTLLHR